MKIFYQIWVDCIIRLKSREANKDDWQVKAMFIMSAAMTFNFVLVMVIFQKSLLDEYFYEINVPQFSGHANYIFTILFLYFSPCVILNYFLIFHKKKYLGLIEKYPYKKGKWIVTYILISFWLPGALLLLGILIYQ